MMMIIIKSVDMLVCTLLQHDIVYVCVCVYICVCAFVCVGAIECGSKT